MKKLSIILIIILTTLLGTLPTLAANFSPLDDPVERYNFNFREGKYKISLSHDRNYQSIKLEDFDVDVNTMLNYSLALEYNVKKGLKIRLNKSWIPEHSSNIINLVNINAIQEGESRSTSNWGLDCTYKEGPTAHEINFSYQSLISTLKLYEPFDINDTHKDIRERISISYKPDIALGGFGMEVGYETNSVDLFHSEQRNSDNYHLTVSYEGQI